MSRIVSPQYVSADNSPQNQSSRYTIFEQSFHQEEPHEQLIKNKQTLVDIVTQFMKNEEENPNLKTISSQHINEQELLNSRNPDLNLDPYQNTYLKNSQLKLNETSSEEGKVVDKGLPLMSGAQIMMT